MTDVVADIIAAVDLSDYDLATAEGRRDLDKFLRRELQKIDDEMLRSHAGQMIKDWRWKHVMRKRSTPELRYVRKGRSIALQYRDDGTGEWLDVPVVEHSEAAGPKEITSL